MTKTIEIYDLAADYDSRQSFYGKARVRIEDGARILTSYTTDVASIKDGVLRINGSYSLTTNRHTREFMKQLGFYTEGHWPWAKIMKHFGPEA